MYLDLTQRLSVCVLEVTLLLVKHKQQRFLEPIKTELMFSVAFRSYNRQWLWYVTSRWVHCCSRSLRQTVRRGTPRRFTHKITRSTTWVKVTKVLHLQYMLCNEAAASDVFGSFLNVEIYWINTICFFFLVQEVTGVRKVCKYCCNFQQIVKVNVTSHQQQGSVRITECQNKWNYMTVTLHRRTEPISILLPPFNSFCIVWSIYVYFCCLLKPWAFYCVCSTVCKHGPSSSSPDELLRYSTIA